MGLSIYYSGKLRDHHLIDDIITESADIANSMHWNLTELPSAPGIPVRGLVLQPENCDPIWLTFHANGNLCSPILYSFLLGREDPKAIEEATQVLVTKTQYAGPETHMAVIKFFRYLSEKYFSHFELDDDSNYWENGDEELCRKRFREGEEILDMLELALAEMESNPDKKEEIYKRVQKRLKRMRRG